MVKKKSDDYNLLHIFINIHNKKSYEIYKFKPSMYSNFQKAFTICKCDIMYMTYKTNL